MSDENCNERHRRPALHAVVAAFVLVCSAFLAAPTAHAAAITATLAVTSQWDTGFVANYRIANPGATELADWKLEFDLPAEESVTNSWSSKLAQSGTHYVLTPEEYNRTIAPEHSISIGFQATLDGDFSAPQNCVLNGESCTSAPDLAPATATAPTPTTAPASAPPPPSADDAAATLAVISQWNTGFVANYEIANTGSTALDGWKLEFDLPADESVTRAWSSKLSKTGTHYVLTPESYNTTIAPGSSVTVGFQAAQTSTYSAPANCQLNGQSCGDGPAPTASVRH
ncbi:cellulose binding domain-containing protein [Mycobacterium marinum]|uniref:cellulose binding domain-containing protein n=1 Tax=Mycobacterium marinum TaxID=1781 RepID=UPI0035630A66